MESKTIGKIQIMVGIIMLLIGVGGFVCVYFVYQDQMNDVERLIDDIFEEKDEIKTYSNETQTIILNMHYNRMENIKYNFIQMIGIGGLISGLYIFISLLFILRGILNISGRADQLKLWEDMGWDNFSLTNLLSN